MNPEKEFWNRLFGKLTFSQVKEWLDKNPQFCICGHSLSRKDLRGLNYAHKGGIEIAERTHPVWLYLHCPKCSYDLSWKKWIVGKTP